MRRFIKYYQENTDSDSPNVQMKELYPDPMMYESIEDGVYKRHWVNHTFRYCENVFLHSYDALGAVRSYCCILCSDDFKNHK